MAQPKKELGGPRQMSTGTKVVIAIFAVMMSLSMMLPSLAPIVASFQENDQTASEDADTSTGADDAATEDATAESESQDKEAESDADTSKDADAKDDSADKDEDKDKDKDKDDATAAVPDNETLQNLAEQYGDEVAKFEQRLSDDPKNLAALYNLGEEYSYWGYNALSSSSTDEEKAYSEGLVHKAEDYYDRYLEILDSVAVRVNRALCDLYLGNASAATEALVALSDSNPDYPLVWANLGLAYESQYDYTSATNAYQKAKETDPNDEYGAKTYAEQRITSILQSTSDFSTLTNEDVLGTNATPTEGLAATLADKNSI